MASLWNRYWIPQWLIVWYHVCIHTHRAITKINCRTNAVLTVFINSHWLTLLRIVSNISVIQIDPEQGLWFIAAKTYCKHNWDCLIGAYQTGIEMHNGGFGTTPQHIDGSMQDRSGDSIANALVLLQSCTYPPICISDQKRQFPRALVVVYYILCNAPCGIMGW